MKTIYKFDGINQKSTIMATPILGEGLSREYDFEKIKQVIWNGIDDNAIGGKIVLQFTSQYDYPIDEFFDTEYGKQNYQIINHFFEQNR